MQSLFLHLQCAVCGNIYSDSAENVVCPDCKKALLTRYDLKPGALGADKLSSRGKFIWRYKELLPVANFKNITTLGEGCTPLIRVPSWEREFKLRGVYIKDEGVNPTGSFKARGFSVAISKAREFGVKEIALSTAGNAGVAASAYAAAAGIKANIFVPKDAPRSFISECEHYGAKVYPTEGTIDHCAMALRKAMREEGANWYCLNTFMQPYRLEGKKTMGYELWEQMNGELPDVIVYPTGGGTGVVALDKAFDELSELGLTGKKKPRLVAVQSEGCAPIVKSFREKMSHCERWEAPQTIAVGLCVPAPLGDYLVLKALRESEGFALAVSDYEIRSAMRKMSEDVGIFPSPEGASTLAALMRLQKSLKISKNSQVVIINSASGARYIELL